MKISCPRCGATLNFLINTDNCYCEYCGSEINVKENIIKLDNYDEYNCSSCGAKLLTTPTTMIKDCVYCGSRQLVKNRSQNKALPQGIIPFKITQSEFIAKYKEFIQDKKYIPKCFIDNPKVLEIKGIYIPYEIYYYDIEFHARGLFEKEFDNEKDFKFLESKIHQKSIILQDTSRKIKDIVTDEIQPFELSKVQSFNPNYLNGFLAEYNDENEEFIKSKVKYKLIKSINQSMENKLLGYKHRKGFLNVKLKEISKRSILLPIWFVSTEYKGKEYTFAINGQNGKVYGEYIPVSFKSCFKKTYRHVSWPVNVLTASLLLMNIEKWELWKLIINPIVFWIITMFCFTTFNFLRTKHRIKKERKKEHKMYIENDCVKELDFKEYKESDYRKKHQNELNSDIQVKIEEV